ncbi:hypothetical protein EmuJ_000260600 [Echinococcus multilocularis]|uniref:Uncharacterized protein n=1 Tax=Echinococcus multilocularis TaxID=6211 RepID=A0A087W273_ECHMU|nr:hypothetical protein EmuJ_000260600 [Echinococcus multilocularis]
MHDRPTVIGHPSPCDQMAFSGILSLSQTSVTKRVTSQEHTGDMNKTMLPMLRLNRWRLKRTARTRQKDCRHWGLPWPYHASRLSNSEQNIGHQEDPINLPNVGVIPTSKAPHLATELGVPMSEHPFSPAEPTAANLSTDLRDTDFFTICSCRTNHRGPIQ